MGSKKEINNNLEKILSNQNEILKVLKSIDNNIVKYLKSIYTDDSKLTEYMYTNGHLDSSKYYYVLDLFKKHILQ